jgi:hypothetical protein
VGYEKPEEGSVPPFRTDPIALLPLPLDAAFLLFRNELYPRYKDEPELPPSPEIEGIKMLRHHLARRLREVKGMRG